MPKKQLSKHRRLSRTEEEAIYQTFLLTNNKAEAARLHNRSYATAIKAIKKIETENKVVALTPGTDDHRNARANIAEALQGRIMGKAADVLESVGEDDLRDGKHTDIEYDDSGRITHKRIYGSSGVEKATMFGILQDKLVVSNKQISDLRGTQANMGLLVPEERDQLLDAIKSKAENIELLRINFKDDVPDLATRVEAASEAYHEEVDPDVITLDDLDNA